MIIAYAPKRPRPSERQRRSEEGNEPFIEKMAPEEGFEPPAKRLTVACSTTELLRIAGPSGGPENQAGFLADDRFWRNRLFLPVRSLRRMEARAGIEPTYEDLQSSAWPLCHRAASGPSGPAKRGADIEVCPLRVNALAGFAHSRSN
jgi:hypothetical protein